MDHDAVSFGLPGPVSRRIKDIRFAYDGLTRRGLSIVDEMIPDGEAYRSNEEGHFAWDVSLLIRAACLIWRVTGDRVHLEQASRWARHISDRTDEGLGRTDWRKRSGSAWSAGSRYTAGAAVVGSVGGAPIKLQAVSDRVIIERPSEDTAVIHSLRSDGTSWTSGEASLLPTSSFYLPDLLARRSSMHSVLLRGLPSPIDLRFLSAGEFDVEPQYAAHFVHTGLIARSLIGLAETLEVAGASSSDVEMLPDELCTVARKALLFHDDEIRVSRGQPWYRTPIDFPTRRLGLELPHNHVVDAATAFLILGRKFKDGRLRALGASLTRPWLDELEKLERRELSHPWYYYPVDSTSFSGVVRDEPLAEREVAAVQRGEDSSHATMRVRALVEWHGIDPKLVTGKTLGAVGLAVRRNFMTNHNGASTLRWLPASPSDPADGLRLGHTDTYSGAWGALYRWDPPMKRHINTIAYRHPPERLHGATLLSAAEILAMNAGVPVYLRTAKSAAS